MTEGRSCPGGRQGSLPARWGLVTLRLPSCSLSLDLKSRWAVTEQKPTQAQRDRPQLLQQGPVTLTRGEGAPTVRQCCQPGAEMPGVNWASAKSQGLLLLAMGSQNNQPKGSRPCPAAPRLSAEAQSCMCVCRLRTLFSCLQSSNCSVSILSTRKPREHFPPSNSVEKHKWPHSSTM